MKQKLERLAIAFLAAGLFLALGPLPAFDSMERRLLDLSFKLRGPEALHPDIVLVEIDDNSLSAVGTWPWPRSYHAALLKAVSHCKPSVIFYDIVFPDPSIEEEDLTFAEEIGKAGNVILPFYFSASSQDRFWEKEIVPPIPLFKEKAGGLGYANNFRDPDGHAREFILTAKRGDELLLHTSLAMAAHHRGLSKKYLAAFAPGKPTLINFPSGYESLRRMSFIDVMAQEKERSQELAKSLEGKIVLVGLTATGTTDLIPAVFSPLYPGVGMQASMTHTLLSRKIIRKVPLWLHGLLLFLFAALALRFGRTGNPLKGLFYTAASLALCFEACQLAFQYLNSWVPYFSVFSLTLLVFLAGELVQFIKTRFETEILSRELSLAASIQQSFLPSNIPRIPGVSVVAASYPARQVGGDLYDILPLSDGNFGICVGDVSGKGVPAALFMAKAISEFRREAPAKSPAEVLSAMNNEIVKEGPGGIFLTLLYLILDPAARKFIFSNGGHEPIFFYRKKSNTVEALTAGAGTPLGVIPECVYEGMEERAESGDVLVLTSDGVKEAMNVRKEIFGWKRMQAALLEAASKEPQTIVDHFLKRIREFVKTAPQHDDLTLVCIKFL